MISLLNRKRELPSFGKLMDDIWIFDEMVMKDDKMGERNAMRQILRPF